MSKTTIIALADKLIALNAQYGKSVPFNKLVDQMVAFARSQNPNFKEGRFRDYIAGKCGPDGGKGNQTLMPRSN